MTVVETDGRTRRLSSLREYNVGVENADFECVECAYFRPGTAPKVDEYRDQSPR